MAPLAAAVAKTPNRFRCSSRPDSNHTHKGRGIAPAFMRCEDRRRGCSKNARREPLERGSLLALLPPELFNGGGRDSFGQQHGRPVILCGPTFPELVARLSLHPVVLYRAQRTATIFHTNPVRVSKGSRTLWRGYGGSAPGFFIPRSPTARCSAHAVWGSAPVVFIPHISGFSTAQVGGGQTTTGPPCGSPVTGHEPDGCLAVIVFAGAVVVVGEVIQRLIGGVVLFHVGGEGVHV